MTDTSATTPTPTLQFEVPSLPVAPPLDVPPEPPAPIATGLASVSETPEARQGIVCKSMIPPDQQQLAVQQAEKLLPEMLENTQVLMDFGLTALDGVNNLVDRLLTEIKSGDSAEIKAVMKNMTLEMKGIQGKYDLSDPKVRERLDSGEPGLLKKWFNKGRNHMQELMADVQSTNTQLDAIARDLAERKVRVIRNIGYLDKLYEENEMAVFQLIYVIAVMEFIAEQAREQVKAIPPDTPETGNKNEELKARLSDLIMQMDVKIGEYKGRLFVAWATSPQVRMMRILNVGMGEKLNEAVGMTIPTFKLVMAQLRILNETEDAKKASDSISAGTNDALQALARNSAAAGKVIMDAIQTPTITVETINVVTQSMVEMADNMIASVDAGAQRRAELEQTIGQSKVVLDGSQTAFNEQVVNSIVGASTQSLALPPTPKLPELLKANA